MLRPMMTYDIELHSAAVSLRHTYRRVWLVRLTVWRRHNPRNINQSIICIDESHCVPLIVLTVMHARRTRTDCSVAAAARTCPECHRPGTSTIHTSTSRNICTISVQIRLVAQCNNCRITSWNGLEYIKCRSQLHKQYTASPVPFRLWTVGCQLLQSLSAVRKLCVQLCNSAIFPYCAQYFNYLKHSAHSKTNIFCYY